jgi:hypothetical protein
MTMVSKILDGGVEEGCFERNSSYQRRGMRGKFGKMYQFSYAVSSRACSFGDSSCWLSSGVSEKLGKM